MGLAELVLTPTGEGVRLRLRVVPGARRDGLVGAHGDALKLAVRAAPEKGRATEAVLRVLAEALGIPAQQVALVVGGASRDKIVSVRGLAPEEIRARLAAAIGSTAPRGGAPNG